MSKTIEEAARDFVANYYELEEYGDEVSDIEIDNSEECFIEGANYLLSLPLSQRLTDEERERVRKMYKRMVVDVENSDSYDCVPASDLNNAMETLESIFGEEFFEEDVI